MTPDSLERCLKFFKRHYNLVDAARVFAALRGEASLPPRAMLVTFDDGWADTAEFAQPVLDRLQVPALVFVAGSAVGSADAFWEERVYCFLATQPNGMVQLERLLGQLGMAPLPVAARANPGEATIRAVIAELGQRERSAVLALAARLPGMDTLPDAMLTPSQLEGLVAAGHAIGGHGMTHQPLTRVSDLGQELSAAQATLGALLRRASLESMSLPHGASSVEVLESCRAAGYRIVFDSRAHLVRLDGPADGPLGRIHLSERAFSDGAGRFRPELLALSLFLRPVHTEKGGSHA